MNKKAFSPAILKRAWEAKHQEKFSIKQPEQSVVDFIQSLDHRSLLEVLDAGCGRGRNANYLAEQGHSVFGIDISTPAIRIARSNSPRLAKNTFYQLSDLTHLPYPENRFDAAICVHVLPYHLKADLYAGIEELWRVLRPGGCVYLDLLACEDVEYGVGARLEENTFLDEGGVPIHFSSEQEIAELMGKFSLQQQSSVEYGSGSQIRRVWEIRARKKGS